MRNYKTPLGKRAATKVVETDEVVSVTYHSTEVYRLNKANGVSVINTGGYSSKTTIDRINECLTEYGEVYRAYLAIRNRSVVLFTIDRKTDKHIKHDFQGSAEINPKTKTIAHSDGSILTF